MKRQSEIVLWKWIGLMVALLIAALSIGLGIWQRLPAQRIIFYAVVTFALFVWSWRNFATRWIQEPTTAQADAVSREGAGEAGEVEGEQELPSAKALIRGFLLRNKAVLGGLVVLLGGFGIASATVTGFFSVLNVVSAIILAALLIISAVMSRFVRQNKSAFIGIVVLIGLFVVGALKVDGFVSAANLKSMLLFASFLGLACIGQTMVALLGGLDLAIPFIIGSANVGLLYLIGHGVPSWIATILILIVGVLIGLLNGSLSFRLQGQALILTLGVGFAVSGITQILTSLGSSYAGNVFGTVPHWLTNLAAMNGHIFGLAFPPVIVIWIVVAVLLIVGMHNTVYGRYLYALGGNRVSAMRLSISERRYWIGAYAISGGVSALTGTLLLGWSGGGFIGVGQPYLFTTLAAVVIGGTSLLGGSGGYGFTVIGVLVLEVLKSFLIGIGLTYQWQQFIFGLLVVPMVALYARSPHIRTQV